MISYPYSARSDLATKIVCISICRAGDYEFSTGNRIAGRIDREL